MKKNAKIIAVSAAVVLCLAGVGTAFAIGNAADEGLPYTADPIGAEGFTWNDGSDDEATEPEITDEVPEGAEVVEDENAPEGTVAVKDASGNVSYVPAAKAEAAVSNGTAKPSAGSSNSGSTSSAAPSAPAPSAPVHTHSFTIAKTIVDQAAWTEYVGKCDYFCTTCGANCGSAHTCPTCGTSNACVRYTEVVAEHPAITHTEYYCSCGAHA